MLSRDKCSRWFTDLHRWVVELAEFHGDPRASSEGKLEAIQMAWRQEWRKLEGQRAPA